MLVETCLDVSAVGARDFDSAALIAAHQETLRSLLFFGVLVLADDQELAAIRDAAGSLGPDFRKLWMDTLGLRVIGVAKARPGTSRLALIQTAAELSLHWRGQARVAVVSSARAESLGVPPGAGSALLSPSNIETVRFGLCSICQRFSVKQAACDTDLVGDREQIWTTIFAGLARNLRTEVVIADRFCLLQVLSYLGGGVGRPRRPSSSPHNGLMWFLERLGQEPLTPEVICVTDENRTVDDLRWAADRLWDWLLQRTALAGLNVTVANRSVAQRWLHARHVRFGRRVVSLDRGLEPFGAVTLDSPMRWKYQVGTASNDPMASEERARNDNPEGQWNYSR